MGTFMQAITDGVLEGGVYGLMAVGLTLIFGVLAPPGGGDRATMRSWAQKACSSSRSSGS